MPKVGSQPATAPDLAKNPRLFEAIQQDIAALGLVGEQIASALLYLAATSRHLAEPLRIIIRGLSSSGKSEIPRRVIPLFPPEAVVEATSITPNALFYMPPGSLEHKIIVAGERKHRADDEAADATAALRQLISEGRISKFFPTRNSNGEFETKRIEQNGPVAYCETTTRSSHLMFKEDLNRCLLVETDDSAEQTKKVLLAVARRNSPSPGKNIVNTQAIIDRHREFQQSLKKCEITIPYAVALAEKMPTGRIEARRAITQVLTTIKAIALLHQHQREANPQGRIEATIQDYELARRLLLKPLSKSIGLNGKAREAYDTLKQKIPSGEFDSNQAEKAGGFNDKMACHRALKELMAMNVILRIAQGKSHQSARWKWTGRCLDELVLPRAESVFVTS